MGHGVVHEHQEQLGQSVGIDQRDRLSQRLGLGGQRQAGRRDHGIDAPSGLVDPRPERGRPSVDGHGACFGGGQGEQVAHEATEPIGLRHDIREQRLTVRCRVPLALHHLRRRTDDGDRGAQLVGRGSHEASFRGERAPDRRQRPIRDDERHHDRAKDPEQHRRCDREHELSLLLLVQREHEPHLDERDR